MTSPHCTGAILPFHALAIPAVVIRPCPVLPRRLLGLPDAAVVGAHQRFANGLMEALVLCEAEHCPVLLTGYDTEAMGALKHSTRSEGPLALVLSPRPSVRTPDR